MYSQINILEDLTKQAEAFIMDNDRLMYRVFFEEAERFCAAQSVLIGGRVGIDLLVGREISTNSFYWVLYCDDTFNTAKEFAAALSRVRSPHIPANTLALQTNIRHKEFTISVNARMLFKIYSMDRYRNMKLIELMGPAQRTGYFTKAAIKCIPEEMQLISIYRTLYTPAKVSLWREELTNESKIYNLVQGSLEKKATKEVRGGDGAKSFARDLQPMLLEKLIRKSDRVLIGDHALTALGLIKDPTRVQFISGEDIDQIVIAVARVLNSACAARGYKVTYVRYNLNIPDDFQIFKYTLYVANGKEQVAIADVFNSARFEMIPYTANNDIKIGNPWVLLRFLFIDIWVLKLILNIGCDNSNFIKCKISANLARCDILRREIARDLLATFQLTNYVGSYVDEYVAKKKLIKEIGEMFPTFYPAKYSCAETTGGALMERGAAEDSTVENTGKTDRGSENVSPRLKSSPIDITADVETKKQILMKIVGKVINGDIMETLRDYAACENEYSKWGVNKSLNTYHKKNRHFLPFIPQHIDTYVDIGCGDGLDLVAVKQRYHVRAGICVDVEDFRDARYKKASSFVQAELDKPLDIPDGAADLVAIFHSIHHMQDSVEERIRDIGRITKPNGIVFLKDHNVTTPQQASNVDFEHLVYMSPEWECRLDDLISNFGYHEPMTYYGSDEIDMYFIAAGFERIWYGEFNRRTMVYAAVYRKKNENGTSNINSQY